MPDMAGAEQAAAGRKSVIASRLAAVLPVVAGASVVCVVLTLLLGGSIFLALAAIAAILAIAAFLPAAGAGGRKMIPEETVTSGINRLSAIRLASAISDPLVIFTGKYEIVYENDAAKAAFGELPPGRDLRTVFRMPSMIRLINEVVSQERSMTADMSERVPVERSYRVIADPVGEGTGLFILMFKDQSEARRIDRMRSDFIANASHELRTPLASVAGFIETLRGPAKEDPKARAQFLEIMQEQTSRMSRLIDDLLSLSRVEMKPNLVPGQVVDLRSVLDSVVESLAHLANGLNVELEREYDQGDFVVAGDKDELFQVFQNLIENACKYGHQGKRIIVFLRRKPVDDGTVFMAGVKDFGPGIPQEHLPRITERFYRVDVDHSRAKKGTGLGLSIVKHIVTRHNAELTMESEPGEGSTFTVTFPLVKKQG
jgi:two-component system phosphate regulon sensor histidine kinase PhoR